jgi:hypothetical protein
VGCTAWTLVRSIIDVGLASGGGGWRRLKPRRRWADRSVVPGPCRSRAAPWTARISLLARPARPPRMAAHGDHRCETGATAWPSERRRVRPERPLASLLARLAGPQSTPSGPVVRQTPEVITCSSA